MYNHSTILTCLRGLIGFEQPYNADIPDIDDDLKISSSGLFVGRLHPLLTYENIMSVAELFARTNVRIWNSSAAYQVGDIVKSGVTYYRAIQEGSNHATSETAFWQPTTLLSGYLRRVYDSSVLSLVKTLFTQKKLNEVAKTLHSSINLFEGVGNISDRITKTGRMAGLKISIKNPDTVAILSYIGLQIDTAQADVKIYLYHSSSNVPVKVFTINHTKSIQFQWHPITKEVLAYLSDTINAGGHYYLCYYEEELTGSMVKKEVGFDGRPTCGSCTVAIANAMLFSKWGKFVAIQPFYVNSENLNDDRSLWDEDSELYVKDSNFGLNLQLSVQCDVSATLCGNVNVFTDALSQQLVVTLLTEMAFSLRTNPAKEKIAGLAFAALDNRENHEYGESKKLIKAIDAVSFDFSSMSAACLPCANKGGARVASVWGR